MDVRSIIEFELQQMLESSYRIPYSKKYIITKEKADALLENIVQKFPKDFIAAQKILRDRCVIKEKSV